MKSSIITLIPLFGLGALAQSSVVSIFFAGTSNDNAYVGSVVNADAKLTTYAIACTSGSQAKLCATGTTITVTEGPSTFAVQTQTEIAGVAGSVSETCSITASSTATCVAAVSLSVNGVKTATTTTVVLTSGQFNYHPVTLTAGVDKLAGTTTKTSTGGAAPTGAVGKAAAIVIPGMAVLAGAML